MVLVNGSKWGEREREYVCVYVCRRLGAYIRFQYVFHHFPNKRPWLFFHLFYQLISLPLLFISSQHKPTTTFYYSLLIINIAMAIDMHPIPIMPQPSNQEIKEQDQHPLVFDASLLRHQLHIPSQFVWPDEEKACLNEPELPVPFIDLGGFLSGDPLAATEASRLVGEACQKHGFFLVVNHGIQQQLISDAHLYMDHFFALPLSHKQRAQRMPGEHCGYASSFTGRFSSKLPWKETLSFQYSPRNDSQTLVKDYLCDKMGKEFEKFG